MKTTRTFIDVVTSKLKSRELPEDHFSLAAISHQSNLLYFTKSEGRKIMEVGCLCPSSVMCAITASWFSPFCPVLVNSQKIHKSATTFI